MKSKLFHLELLKEFKIFYSKLSEKKIDNDSKITREELEYIETTDNCFIDIIEQEVCEVEPSHFIDSAYVTDGTWIWNISLAHYITEHNLQLPEKFVNHIREEKYQNFLDEDHLLSIIEKFEKL